MDAHTRWMKIAALALLGLGTAFYLVLAIGEMVGGDVGGVQHLPPAVILSVLLWSSWGHPFAAGTILLALAVPLGLAYLVLLIVRDLPPTWALVVVLPPVVTGTLLVRVARRERESR